MGYSVEKKDSTAYEKVKAAVKSGYTQAQKMMDAAKQPIRPAKNPASLGSNPSKSK